MASKWIQDDESGASLLGNAANQPVDHISVENLSQDPSPDDETNRHFQQRRSRWRAYLPFTGSDARRRRHGEVLDFTDGKTKVNRRRGLCRSCMNITLGMLVVLWVDINI